jgi:chemotaxis signal transduction protein
MAFKPISRAWVMRIGDSRIAVSPQELREVVEIDEPTRLPLSPAPMLGLIANRGTVLPVIDFGELTDKPSEGPFQGAVVQVGDSSFALAIHEIIGIIPWDPERTSAEDLGIFGLERAYQQGNAITRLNLEAILNSIKRQVEDGELVSR